MSSHSLSTLPSLYSSFSFLFLGLSMMRDEEIWGERDGKVRDATGEVSSQFFFPFASPSPFFTLAISHILKSTRDLFFSFSTVFRFRREPRYYGILSLPCYPPFYRPLSRALGGLQRQLFPLMPGKCRLTTSTKLSPPDSSQGKGFLQHRPASFGTCRFSRPLPTSSEVDLRARSRGLWNRL